MEKKPEELRQESSGELKIRQIEQGKKMNANVLNNVLHGNILHIANYEAAYRGNFVQSLDLLSDRMEEENVKSYYIFPKQKDENAPAMGWMRELLARKRITGWLSGNISKDAALIRKVIKKRNILLMK